MPIGHVHFGEISLSGAIRASSYMANRLKEAQKLGFKAAVMPAAGELETEGLTVNLSRLKHLKDLADALPACE